MRGSPDLSEAEGLDDAAQIISLTQKIEFERKQQQAIT